MASLRYRNDKWQVQVRRYGHTPQSKSFRSKADSQRWARHVEAELDRTLIPNDPRLLSTITVAEVLTRYRDTHTRSHRGHIQYIWTIPISARCRALAKGITNSRNAERSDDLLCANHFTLLQAVNFDQLRLQ
jgi:hypothetical protein